MQSINPMFRQSHHRSYGKHNSRSNNNSLKSKHKPNSIPSNPGRLEIRHWETATRAPHVHDGRDAGCLFRVFLQYVGGYSTACEWAVVSLNEKNRRVYTIFATIPTLTKTQPKARPIQCFSKCSVNPYVSKPPTRQVVGNQTPWRRYSGRQWVCRALNIHSLKKYPDRKPTCVIDALVERCSVMTNHITIRWYRRISLKTIL